MSNKYIRVFCDNCGEYQIIPEGRKVDFVNKSHACGEPYAKSTTGTWKILDKKIAQKMLFISRTPLSKK